MQVAFTPDEIVQLDARRDSKQSRASLLRECFIKRYGFRGALPKEARHG